MEARKCKFSSPLIIAALYVLVYTREMKEVSAAPHIRVWSRVVNPALQIHCKSGDTDIGLKTVHNGQSFEWHFTPKFWGGTLFYCNFRKGSKLARIRVYKEKFFKESSKDMCYREHPANSETCVYEAREDGFYLNHWDNPNPPAPWTKVGDWDSQQ